MQRTIDRLERELYYQKQPEEPVIEKPKPVAEEPRYSPYAIPVNDELHQKLTQQLSSLAIPNDVITILRRQGIYTVFDLVSLSKSDYEDIYGLSVSGEAKLKSCITDMGLKLFMPLSPCAAVHRLVYRQMPAHILGCQNPLLGMGLIKQFLP